MEQYPFLLYDNPFELYRLSDYNARHIPMREVLQGLRACGYEGIVTIEHFGSVSYASDIRDSARWLMEELG